MTAEEWMAPQPVQKPVVPELVPSLRSQHHVNRFDKNQSL
jgi:hypothetical protein